MGAMTLVGNVTGAAIGLFFPVSKNNVWNSCGINLIMSHKQLKIFIKMIMLSMAKNILKHDEGHKDKKY